MCSGDKILLFAGNPSTAIRAKVRQSNGQGGNQQERDRIMDDLNAIRGYFFGVLLGDGHINYSQKALENREQGDGRKAPHILLKVCDYEFAEKWMNCITTLTGKKRVIIPIKQDNPKHRTQYLVRCHAAALVDECENLTKHKTVIPEEVWSYGANAKKAFVMGLMDSEGWINCALSSLKINDLTLGFGCCDPWFFDFVKLVNDLGIKTSKIYTRPAKLKKNGEMGRKIHIIRLDILDYIDAGLDFAIKRKSDRLAFCSKILRDYTQNYPRYADYYGVDDRVQSS